MSYPPKPSLALEKDWKTLSIKKEVKSARQRRIERLLRGASACRSALRAAALVEQSAEYARQASLFQSVSEGRRRLIISP